MFIYCPWYLSTQVSQHANRHSSNMQLEDGGGGLKKQKEDIKWKTVETETRMEVTGAHHSEKLHLQVQQPQGSLTSTIT